VPLSYDNSAAVVLLPPVRGRLGDRKLLRWLSQAQLEQVREPENLLAQVLGVLGREPPIEGLAALRMWGQTGDRPGTWIAAADPVYMEPRLDRLFLHVLGPEDISRSEMRGLFDGLQETLGTDGALGFARLGSFGYVRATQPIVTAAIPPALVDGRNPDQSLPSSDTAADTLKLISEIEMTLHGHPVNAERMACGQPPVNSLWIWGGGYAPERSSVRVPPLFADDSTLRGYWESVDGSAEAWPGTIDACLDACANGFVAVMPADSRDSAELQTGLLAVREALRSGRLRHAVLVSADGIRATLRRSDRLRVWRRTSALLEGRSA
jgi:hypothetical protein